jgi:hypothetical protein
VNADQAQDKLERRARALLRAYPAEYRRERGEEIIGTLVAGWEGSEGGAGSGPARN